MPSIVIPDDIILQYDNDNIFFNFPMPTMTIIADFYYMIYDLTGILTPIKVAINELTYNLVEGITSGQTYIFRIRVFDVNGNRSELTSARMITIPSAPIIENVSEDLPEELIDDSVDVIPAEELAPIHYIAVIENDPISEEELAPINYIAAIENDPISEEEPQIILGFPGVEKLIINRNMIILLEPEPNFVPAVEFSKYIESKNNIYLANGYQGRNKYDFDTLLKIRMGKVTTTLK